MPPSINEWVNGIIVMAIISYIIIGNNLAPIIKFIFKRLKRLITDHIKITEIRSFIYDFTGAPIILLKSIVYQIYVNKI